MALGVTVQNRTAPPARGVPTDTGTAFVVGDSDVGTTTEATLCRSLADFAVEFGTRHTENAPTYDWVDTFFREGGQRCYVGLIGDGDIDDALALFTKGLGPGQVAAPLDTPGATTYGKLLDHAVANNRWAVMDVSLADNTEAEIATKAGLVPSTANKDEFGALFGPWHEIPGPAGTIGGAARQVPASAATCALLNRVDGLGNPNRAPAGRDFPLQYVTGFVYDILDADVETLLTAGANSYIEKYGVLQLYGFQTARVASPDDPFWQANCSRGRMWLTAQAQLVGEQFMFKPIDGRGVLAGAFKRALEGVCLNLYGVDGLFGETAAEAFSVETGVSVNTDETIAAGELHGTAEVVFSLHAKSVVIDLVSVPVTGSVSAA